MEIVKAEGRISSVRLQREFGVGMPEAGRIRDQLMAEGVIDERGAVPVEGAGEGGKKSGAITAPKAKQAAPTKPLRLEEAYPELSVEKMSAEERAELQAAHDAMMKLDDHEAA